MFNPLLTVSVPPNSMGYLYKNNQLYKRLRPGVYHIWAGWATFKAILISTTEQFVVVNNQEVLTQDNIALRFSYVGRYGVTDCDRFVAKFDVFQNPLYIFSPAEQLIHYLSQVYLREAIAQVNSEHLNEQRQTFLATVPESLQAQLADYGITLFALTLRDLTFPKAIQELFARRLESKIRAQSDLENARTAVATARALKNASELMKNDENIRFLQLLETLTKISATGKHTFVLGELTSPTVPPQP